MYKVFINEKEICFTKALENFDAFENALVLRFFHGELSEFLVDLLTNGKRIQYIFIVTEQVEQAFNAFQENYKLIRAAGGLVRNQESDLLVIHRLNKWDLPKGKLEPNESAEEGALREVEEECGISQLQITEELPTSYHMYQEKDQWILKETRWFAMSTDDTSQPVAQTEEQITQAKWVNAVEVKNTVLENTYASLKGLFEAVISTN